MNLIEQYGGYDNTKKEYEKAVVDGWRKDVLDAFSKALLEYRRENNIYEVGDYLLHPMFKSVFVVDNVFNSYVYATNKSGYRTKLSTDVIRHATDKEIEQGYRDNTGK